MAENLAQYVFFALISFSADLIVIIIIIRWSFTKIASNFQRKKLFFFHFFREMKVKFGHYF